MRDAVLPESIAQHCEEIQCADGIIMIHPNWWGQPPAILKGWVDRVLRPGVAYRFVESDGGEGVPVGLLKARIAVIFNTSNTTPVRERTVFGDPLETLWKNCIFGLCGVNSVVRKTFAVMVGSSDAQRMVWLDEAEDVIEKAFASVSG
jgi:putative NADPH-quinone reductase